MSVYEFEYRTAKAAKARKPFKPANVNTFAPVTAKSANAALRLAGFQQAFDSPRVKVVTGHKTGRQYRAVKVAA